MPKFVSRSRWIEFSIDNNLFIENKLKVSGCNCAQWVTIDNIINGYLFFQNATCIPKKKQWIPGASFSYSTKEDLVLKYKSVTAWSSYGSNVLFSNEKEVLPVPSPKVEPTPFSKPDLIPYAIKLGDYTISASSVESFLMDPDAYLDYFEELDFGQRDLELRDFAIINQHINIFIPTLIQAQIDNY